MDLLAMRPSDWRRLAETPMDSHLADELVAALDALLQSEMRSSSPGMEDIYLTAVEFSEAGLWDSLPKERIAQLVSSASMATAKALLDGMPSSCRHQVQSLLDMPALSA